MHYRKLRTQEDPSIIRACGHGRAGYEEHSHGAASARAVNWRALSRRRGLDPCGKRHRVLIKRCRFLHRCISYCTFCVRALSVLDGLFMIILFLTGRSTKFSASVVNEVDCNGDAISKWCKPGVKDTEAFCILCSVTISCAQHGTAAVKRHASQKKHLEAAAKRRDSSGVLLAPKTVQATIDFSQGTPRATLQDQVCGAEAIFAMAVVSKDIPYAWGTTATDIYKKMFTDSDVAKNFNCARAKLSYVISDGLGPFFKSKLVAELCRPNVFFALVIDETPKPEQRVQQLDLLVRYFSESRQQVVVEHLHSFNLGRATGDIIVECIEDALAELPRQGLLCFFSDGPNVMKSVKSKLKQRINPNLVDVGECTLHKVHNAFSKGLDAFCSDVEQLVRDVYYYFKHSSVRSESLKEQQELLGLIPHVFLRHVSNRWLTLQDSLGRVLEQFTALQSFFCGEEPRCAPTRCPDSAQQARCSFCQQDSVC